MLDVFREDTDRFVKLANNDNQFWFSEYRSNLHKLYPANERTHEEVLKVLARGNFDLVLDAVGTALNMTSLAVYQTSFVSHSVRADLCAVIDVGNGVYKMVISLPLDDDDDNNGFQKEYNFLRGVGGMIVYIADINEMNVQQVGNHTLTQIFPLSDTTWLLAQAGRHWRHDSNISMLKDSGRKPFLFDDEPDDCDEREKEGKCETDIKETRKKCLHTCKVYIKEGPELVEKVNDTHYNLCIQNRTGGSDCQIFEDTDIAGDFVTPCLETGQMFPIVWRDGGQRTTHNAFQIGLPPELTTDLLNYSNRIGATDLFRQLTGDKPIAPLDDDDEGNFIHLEDGNLWYAQRPKSTWKSNLHWFSPANETSYEDYLKVLAKGNFDEVLKTVGITLGFEGLAVYQVSFIGVSHCEQGELVDTSETLV